MANSFSFSRFGSYAASEIRSSLRAMLVMLAITVGVAVVAYFFIGIDNFLSDTEDVQKLVSLQVAGAFTSVAGIAYCLIIISQSFRQYHNPLSAPQAMLLPVTKGEKFTFAFLRNVVVYPAILFGIWSLVSYIFYWIYGSPEIVGLDDIEHEMEQLEKAAFIFWERIAKTLTVVTVAALFFFCSIAFRRRQSFVAVVVLVALGLVVISALNIYVKFIHNQTEVVVFGNYINQMITTSTILALASISLFYFSWRKFKNLQVR